MLNQQDKAYVIMAYPWDEVWGPVAVFSTKAEAERAQRVLTFRLHGAGEGYRRDYPAFGVVEVDASPVIEDTGRQRFGTVDDDGEWWPIYLDEDMDGPSDVYYVAMNRGGEYVPEPEASDAT